MLLAKAGFALTVVAGAMFAMSPTITLKGSIKFSLKKFVAGGELSTSTFTGPGELLLAPPSLGDITNIRLSGSEMWSVSKDGFLACTQGIVKEYKSQSLSKAMFSGEGLFVYKISGSGILWVTSMGAILRKDVSISTCFFPHRVLTMCNSFRKTRSTLWTMAIWLPGIASTCLSGWQVEVSSPTCPLVKV